jgi:glutathione S-transferase
MYKLYGRPGAGNVCVEAMLAECSAPFELIALDRDAEGRLPESLRAVNPMMQMPALIMPDGSVMTESAAMLIHLADVYPQAGLAPAIGTPARAQYLRWMAFLSSALYVSNLRCFYPHHYTTDPDGLEAVKAKAIEDLDNEYAVLAKDLGAKPYLTGATITAADIYAAMLIQWTPDIEALARKYPNLKALHDRVATRPLIAPVWKRNGMAGD